MSEVVYMAHRQKMLHIPGLNSIWFNQFFQIIMLAALNVFTGRINHTDYL